MSDTSFKDTRLMTLPTDSTARKAYPLLSGCIKYFPAALAGVANISKLGNDKHNPGQALHHARGKSMDHGDCIVRHLMDTEDLLAAFAKGDASATKEAILLEVSSLAWRALAYSQELHEQFGAPLAPSAKIESTNPSQQVPQEHAMTEEDTAYWNNFLKLQGIQIKLNSDIQMPGIGPTLSELKHAQSK